MLDKLQAISDRMEAIVSQMEDPATYGDPDLLRRLTKEQKELEPVVLAYRAYRKAEADRDAAQELLVNLGMDPSELEPTDVKMDLDV